MNIRGDFISALTDIKSVLIIKVTTSVNMGLHQEDNVTNVGLVFERLQNFQNEFYQGLNYLCNSD